MRSEFALIRQLETLGKLNHRDRILQGIGDDCAVIERNADFVDLISTDCLVEGVHFSFDYFSPYDLGFKSLAVNLSDIAAMCGNPLCAFVSLAIPKYTPDADVDEFYRGFQDLASRYKVELAGGDTSRSLSGWFVNVTIMGETRRDQCKYRSGAKSGDVIAVVGELGWSALGLVQLQKDRFSRSQFAHRHKHPVVQLEAGLVLRGITGVHAVIDVSDGVIQDLSHVARASHVQAQLEWSLIPQNDEFLDAANILSLQTPELMLTGGEDYALLVCLEQSCFANVQNELSKQKIIISKIGNVKCLDDKASDGDSDAVTVVDAKDEVMKLKNRGHDHFMA